ncbi:pyridoxal phosphate-dependent decarboxylase family protein [Aquicella lusitana]|uniref:Glutamate/tyrosine decarboxylase-like PLP-dependent enzyme n=1 Tax=Aquicella lusitana TaxID=254246 RepID=A0A370GZE1_9COXI|nr:aminotransferase class V-fold PLP-dependent enzyme [Aquicella lusitana]RDI48650.1 glutamate/tyrosine decarboxylase-like PLP-dependent enzyme [Aquicella lusitana]VVC73973.1 L-2,4-diaminobutyrate decarboxylase [Aquicella lusitana]
MPYEINKEQASEALAFKAAAHALIESFIEDEKNAHVLPIYKVHAEQRAPSVLNLPLSLQGEGLSRAAAVFQDQVAPYLVRNHHARFFNWVVGGRTPAAVLGDFYTTVFDQIVMLCGHGVASQIENQTIQWLLELFDLPLQDFQGIFTTGATEANLCALAAARQWHGERQKINVSDAGLYGLQPPAVIASAPHASIDKAMQVLGLGRRHLIKTGNSAACMDLAALEKLLQHHQNAIVVANCGEVNTGSFDSLETIAALCRQYNAWLHVDAAFGLFARCYPATHALAEGIEWADSITCDGHKLGNVPYGCGFLFINKKNYTYLTKTFSTVAPYLSGDHDHPMNTRVANSQRFLALPMWLSLLAYGKAGYQDMVKRQYEFAQAMGEWIKKQEAYELIMPVVFNIVLFRHKKVASSEDNQQLIKQINATNQLSLSGTMFNGIPALRLAVANWCISLDQDQQPVCEGLLAGSHAYLFEKEVA